MKSICPPPWHGEALDGQESSTGRICGITGQKSQRHVTDINECYSESESQILRSDPSCVFIVFQRSIVPPHAACACVQAGPRGGYYCFILLIQCISYTLTTTLNGYTVPRLHNASVYGYTDCTASTAVAPCTGVRVGTSQVSLTLISLISELTPDRVALAVACTGRNALTAVPSLSRSPHSGLSAHTVLAVLTRDY